MEQAPPPVRNNEGQPAAHAALMVIPSLLLLLYVGRLLKARIKVWEAEA